MGGRRKRRPICNGSDRGSSFALLRKGADFRLVLNHEKGADRLNCRGYFRRCGFGSIEGPAGALRQPSTNPYREGDRRSVTGCFAAPYQGLSPVRGNLHAGFSGGRVTVTSPGYPTEQGSLQRHRPRDLAHDMELGKTTTSPEGPKVGEGPILCPQGRPRLGVHRWIGHALSNGDHPDPTPCEDSRRR